MTADEQPPNENPRDAKRRRVLEAAKACFRQHGFHAASMSEISKTAGMSIGHIYHYFESKEAIIGAIVEEGLQSVLEFTERFQSADDIVTEMIERSELGAELNFDPDNAKLRIEIAAEAARNPKIAAIVTEADRQARASLSTTMALARTAAGRDPNAELSGRVELLSAIFEGLMIRGIRNPDIDKQAVIKVLQTLVSQLIHD